MDEDDSYPRAPPNTPAKIDLGYVLREELKELQIQQYRVLKNKKVIKAALDAKRYGLFKDLAADCRTRQSPNLVYKRASRIFSGHPQLKASFSMFLCPADRAGYDQIFAAELAAAELAAKVTCFLLSETTETIRRAENWTSGSSPIAAIPTPSFKGWVFEILSEARVTPSVIHLALMFIYRLKTLSLALESMASSQYRLLIVVALMLGSKVLDDKTYSNKSWAQISGISVKEINLREIEFLAERLDRAKIDDAAEGSSGGNESQPRGGGKSEGEQYEEGRFERQQSIGGAQAGD
ncbi:hypothetical protein O988_05847, partial [Pseudogymnoascus sp. VKM F-3808]